jgi:outer membrane receptor for ferrienterochelin and colicins
VSARLFAPLAALAIVTFAARAGADDVTDLEGALSEPIVSTPSKEGEAQSLAPATSSSVTAEELRRYGIRSLDEAINFLSLGMVATNPLYAAEVGARGVLLTNDYGNHVLLLVNGHQINEPWNGTAYYERGAGVPMELIDHIEIILGPGSVLYGSNAMLGVINVVTKRAKDYRGLRLIVDGSLSPSVNGANELRAPSFASSYTRDLGTGL